MCRSHHLSPLCRTSWSTSTSLRLGMESTDTCDGLPHPRRRTTSSPTRARATSAPDPAQCGHAGVVLEMMLSLIYPEVFVVFSRFCTSVRLFIRTNWHHYLVDSMGPQPDEHPSPHLFIMVWYWGNSCDSQHEYTHHTHLSGYYLLNSNLRGYLSIVSLLHYRRRAWHHSRQGEFIVLSLALTAILYDAAIHSLRSGIFWFYIMSRGGTRHYTTSPH